MKKYIGTKEVLAQPMHEYDAVEKGFARINDDNHEWRNGYHVQYTNPDGSVYDSWSPKDVFERAYKVSDTPLDRMYVEYNELLDKLNKLTIFLGREDKEKIAGEFQCELMELQRVHMKSYLLTLRSRIELMKK